VSTTSGSADGGPGLEEREFRAAVEGLATAEIAPDYFHVYNASGEEYAVDRRLGACTCPDVRYRNATCKHIRRVEMVVGDRALPPIPEELVDPLLLQNRERRGVTSDV
jgi:hypothetical protein